MSQLDKSISKLNLHALVCSLVHHALQSISKRFTKGKNKYSMLLLMLCFPHFPPHIPYHFCLAASNDINFSHSPVRAILIKCLKSLRCWVVLRRSNVRKCAQIPATLGADYSRDLETLKYWVHSTQITRDRAPKCKGGNQCIFSAYFM